MSLTAMSPTIAMGHTSWAANAATRLIKPKVETPRFAGFCVPVIHKHKAYELRSTGPFILHLPEPNMQQVAVPLPPHPDQAEDGAGYLLLLLVDTIGDGRTGYDLQMRTPLSRPGVGLGAQVTPEAISPPSTTPLHDAATWSPPTISADQVKQFISNNGYSALSEVFTSTK